VHLRGHMNIRKRLLIHTAGFNLGLLMRQLIGVGTPRGRRGRLIIAIATLLALTQELWERLTLHRGSHDTFHARTPRDRGTRHHAHRLPRTGFHHGLLGFLQNFVAADGDAADSAVIDDPHVACGFLRRLAVGQRERAAQGSLRH
jgi:hypothetical protein